MNLEVSIGAAILAGVISFLSPCVLPLVPPYLCYISGVSLEDLTSSEHPDAKKHRRTVLLTGFVFVLGFSTVFTLLGATASAAGQVLRDNLPLLAKLAGVAIIIMGLHFLGAFKIAFLSREARYHHQGASVGLWGAYLIGVAFAFGWTPCIGPVLAAILSVAGTSESVSRGFTLLAAYSLGLGIPFMLAAFSVDSFLSFFRKFRRHLPMVERLMGVALVATGILFLTGGMQNLSYWLLETFPGLSSIG
jgi:cytochrome c-type biogenesis protein